MKVKFKDGEVDIKVGDNIFAHHCNNYGTGSYLVTKVGRKYVHTEDFKFCSFGRVTGDYGHHYSLYSSEDAFNNMQFKQSLIRDIIKYTSNVQLASLTSNELALIRAMISPHRFEDDAVITLLRTVLEELNNDIQI
jgi:hypothetical protein